MTIRTPKIDFGALLIFLLLPFWIYPHTLRSRDLDLSSAPSGVLTALELYHTTREYNQTLEEFYSQPSAYFERRLAALEILITSLKSAPRTPALIELKKRAKNKRAYLQAVPKGLHPAYIRRRLIPLKKWKHPYREPSPLLTIHKVYWIEKCDPLHRAGPEMELRINLWKRSEIPSFFIFLETLEQDVALESQFPFTRRVHYLNQEEREKHRLEFRNGLAYVNGKLFDTEQYLEQFPESSLTIYVMSDEGVLYVFPHKRYVWQHSTVLQAAPVIDAGEMFFEKGILRKISNRSGHYTPTKWTLLRTLQVLADQAKNVVEAEVKVFEFHPLTKRLITRISYRAGDFLAERGMAIPVRAERCWRPLHAIVWNGDTAHFSDVCKRNHLNAQESGGNTPLHLATLQGRIDCIQLLHQAGASMNPRRKGDGNTPLHLAVMGNQATVVQALLALGSDTMLSNYRSENALHLAAKRAYSTVFSLLVQATNKKVLQLQAAELLILAIQNRKKESALVLLEILTR